MSARTYPREVWVLTPSFNPKQVTVVEAYGSSNYDYGDVTATGKLYYCETMFPTKELAVAAGWGAVAVIQAGLDKRAASLLKKRAALTQAGS